ncbi:MULTISPECIES: pyruvate, phosphate dikinase [Psychrilyobacter]|uniref:Pyruvate, phosphate dikinase n=1 Tax=Psychrilyobacter piezotolerans TaxID=2293438 RepID=A0ABX9KER2_9FUSO|nr:MULTISPECIES: pyruvate, phosphate dikinase [Psychrilyobacter]MCS5421709.1 pyruvate, phosphate dikinase [Psychrilyobacter sp. S5]NDI78874.1 pyruvate, phosphate dikinase [Psychrilyobacter piezotolerans]RDE59380.1 pyruvate, phosphate dikinase [Psychrilyobacter sp. S5]REI39883.1 pyruvate, phosphate dikinase [Psychrilyobacter piezotolerans]
MKKFIYPFKDGGKEMKSLLGGKGANLSEMTKLGLPIPQGFVITTEASMKYYEEEKKIWKGLKKEIEQNLKNLEAVTDKNFGGDNPLFVSVRSGAAISMPGMMDTILNLGLNDKTYKLLATQTGNEQFAFNSYKRFIQMFSEVVYGIEKYKYDLLEKELEKNGTEKEAYIKEYKNLFKSEVNFKFPEDPMDQLLAAIEAVFSSWNNPRAIYYRNLNNIPHDIGTGVTVQSMVFGNMGDTSGTGVVFTRNPSCGENKLFGEFLINAQGEDVVAGIRTPKKIEELEAVMPETYKELIDLCNLLEDHYKDMQDIEFTIENNELYILQTRNGKRTANAAIKVATDLVNEGIITKEKAIMMIEPEMISQLLHPTFSEEELANSEVLVTGLAASPGAATGRVYFSSEKIKENNGGILVRLETSPEDIEGMNIADGILTVRGGMTSHAAVVARGMGRCCICGCGSMDLDEEKKEFKVGNITVSEGEYISLNGSTGNVYLGELNKSDSGLTDEFKMILDWSSEIGAMKVLANADTPLDAKVAYDFGANGIGLCRTEHMFFEEKKINHVREMILAENSHERKIALDNILPLQRLDFIGIFEAMKGNSVTVRLIDPPLHEFLPKEKEEKLKLTKSMGITMEDIENRMLKLEELNPMLGHRGCRLGITYPEIYEMQSRAIIEAAIEVKKSGIDVKPEIMIPLVGKVEELGYLRERLVSVVDEVIENSGIELEYKIGTMIEVPRACVTAGEIAKEADFFSFGTNDLTQITFGYSRDDAGKFISDYREKDILEADPFETIDIKGVGKLMEMAVTLGRGEKKNLKIGICGEHGGDPKSIEFFHSIGLAYVSCSPYRIPIAKLAVAQNTIKGRKYHF